MDRSYTGTGRNLKVDSDDHYGLGEIIVFSITVRCVSYGHSAIPACLKRNIINTSLPASIGFVTLAGGI